jgi:hypothetical protein
MLLHPPRDAYKGREIGATTKQVKLSAVANHSQQPTSKPRHVREDVVERFKSSIGLADGGLGATCVVTHNVAFRVERYRTVGKFLGACIFAEKEVAAPNDNVNAASGRALTAAPIPTIARRPAMVTAPARDRASWRRSGTP